MVKSQGAEGRLPVRGALTSLYTLSILIACLIAAASLIGLLDRDAVYPADDLVQAFVPTDVVNLIIGLPVLLASLVLVRRGQRIGLLLWPGALFYGLYHDLVYVLSVPINPVFLLHLLLLMLSVYTLVGLIVTIDGEAVRRRLAGAVPERLAAGILAVLGLLFALRVVAAFVGALASRTPIAQSERALLITDFLVAPAWVMGGLLLWRRQALGYLVGLGLLFQASMLFVGLVVFLIIQPFLTSAPFLVTDIFIVFGLGLVGFIPLALFVRGVLSAR